MFTNLLRRDIDVRARLPRDVRRILYVAAWAGAAIGLTQEWVIFKALGRIGGDSHAYWHALHGPMYTTAPGTLDAFLYSPVFAQLLWPIAQLPAPLFVALFSIGDAVLLVWLLRPLGWRWVAPLLVAASPEICSGNVFVPLAWAAVMGFQWPGAWALPALTKITPTLGPLWWLTRQEWRGVATSLATTLAIAIPSVAITPHLWSEWLHFLAIHATQTAHTLGAPGVPGLIHRLPVAWLLVGWGSRRNQRWTIPVAMVLATPNLWLGSYTLLAGIPRLIAPRRTAPPGRPEPTTAE